MNTVVRGGLAGTVGTGVMTLVIAVGRAAGLLRTPPPRQIIENVAAKVGIRHRLPEPAVQASAMAAHLGYGATSGVLYTLVRPLLPESPMLAGLGYGGAVWGASYLGLMPRLGLYPGPKADSLLRVAVMIAAHAVFGVGVAETERRLRDGRSAG